MARCGCQIEPHGASGTAEQRWRYVGRGRREHGPVDAVQDRPQLHHQPRTLPLRTVPSTAQQTVCCCCQGYRFSGISGSLEMSGSSAKVIEKSGKGRGICVVREI